MTTLNPSYANAFSAYRIQGQARLTAWVERIVRLLPDIDDTILVDIGCGVGRFSGPLSKHVGRVIGVDKSAHMLRQVLPSVLGNCFYLCASAEALPVKSESVDVAFASMVLEHVANKDAFFSEADRILKRQGIFVLRTMLPDDISSTTWYDFVPTATRLELERTLSLPSLEELATQSGLSVCQSRTFTDVVEAEVTRQLPERFSKRSYEILSHVSDEELNDAIARVRVGVGDLIEKTSSSLVLMRKCL